MRLERPEGAEATIAGHSPVMGRAVPQKKKFSFGGENGLAGALFKVVRGIITTAILAAILALLIQMARAPDGIPAARPADEARATQLYQSVRSFADTTYPRAMDISQQQANNYLAARIVPAAEGGSRFRAKFQRAFVMIGNGKMTFLVEQRFFGWPIFLFLKTEPATDVDASTGKRKSRLIVSGGGIGRVMLPAFAVRFLRANLKPVIDSTAEAAEVLRQADGVVFTPGVAKLSWAGRKIPGG